MTKLSLLRPITLAATLALGGLPTMSLADTVYLEITLTVAPADRPAAAAVYEKYKSPFLETVPGALTKQLLIRDEDVQVLHGFDTVADANAYLTNPLFTNDVVGALGPLLQSAPEIRVYSGN
jgi:hypothetical protein